MEFVIAANLRLKELAERCIRSIEALGYRWTAYDLGGLGFGRQFPVHDETFHSQGYYESSFTPRKSTALHKPGIIADMLTRATGPFVYLDADTRLMQRIDEVIGGYDIGVTVRPFPEQWELGPVNAGVLFFNPTSGTKFFVERWQIETVRVGNDQEALTNLIFARFCRVAEFPGLIYNWYYFPEKPPPSAKILHEKVSRLLREIAVK